jgi:hypothetical protein
VSINKSGIESGAKPITLYKHLRFTSAGVDYGISPGSQVSVAYGNGLWVLGTTNGRIATSTTCTEWTEIAGTTTGFGAEPVIGAAYGGIGADAKWVAAGDAGIIATSTNGTDWTQLSARPFEDDDVAIISVAYGNGKWIALGSDGRVSTSEDGETWTQPATILDFGAYTTKVFYGGGLWIAGGANGKVATSPDGATWRQISGHGGRLMAAAYGGGRWVLLNNVGSLYYSN